MVTFTRALLAFCVIRLNTASSQQSASEALITSLSEDTETTTDLAEPLEGLTFDTFKESAFIQEMNGIELSAYDKVFEIIASTLQLPDHIKSQLLAGKYIKVNMQEIMDFKFKKGDDGKFAYGRMYTRKSQNGEVDIAIAMYNLDFKLSPKIVQYEKKTTFLGFVTGSTKMWKRESASLSLRQDAVLQAYFLRRALNKLRMQNGIKLTGGKYCTAGDADCEQ